MANLSKRKRSKSRHRQVWKYLRETSKNPSSPLKVNPMRNIQIMITARHFWCLQTARSVTKAPVIQVFRKSTIVLMTTEKLMRVRSDTNIAVVQELQTSPKYNVLATKIVLHLQKVHNKRDMCSRFPNPPLETRCRPLVSPTRS